MGIKSKYLETNRGGTVSSQALLDAQYTLERRCGGFHMHYETVKEIRQAL